MKNESDTDGGDEAVMYSASSAVDSAEKVSAETLPVRLYVKILRALPGISARMEAETRLNSV